MNTHDGVFSEDDEELDWNPFCECGALHSDEEIDWNQCDACGKLIEFEEPVNHD